MLTFVLSALIAIVVVMVVFAGLFVSARTRHRTRLYRAVEQRVAAGKGVGELERVRDFRKKLFGSFETAKGIDFETWSTGYDGSTTIRDAADLNYYEQALHDELDARGKSKSISRA